MNISICIAKHRHPGRQAALLEDFRQCRGFAIQFVSEDNAIGQCALGGGPGLAGNELAGQLALQTATQRIASFLQHLAKALPARALAVVSWPLGRRRDAAHGLTRASANFGTSSTLWGWCHHEYA